MAQLRDTLIQGSARVTDTLYSNNINLADATASLSVFTDANKNLITKSAADTRTAIGVGASGTHADSYFVKAITSTDNSIVRFDGTAGQIQGGGKITLSDEGYLRSYNTTRWTLDWYIFHPGASKQVAELYFDSGDATNITSGTLYWRQFSPTSTASNTPTAYHETYSMPTVTKDLTANKTYSIITTKNLSSITSVGTLTSNLTIQSGGIWVQGGSAAGSDNTRMGLTSGMPDKFPYNSSKRGTFIYSNAIAFADPLNGNGNNDAGWIRHLEGTANSGLLEIAVGDDGNNEQVAVRRYNSSNAIAKEIKLFDASGNSSFPGVVHLTNTTASTSSTTGALVVGGGIGTGAASFLTGSVHITGTAASNPLIVRGISGCHEDGIRGDTVTDAQQGLYLNLAGGPVYVGDSAATDESSLIIQYTSDASSSNTGALRVSGGVGIAKKLYVGSTASFGGAISTANNTLNNIGDDAQLGDQNISGTICIKGKNGNTSIRFLPYSGTAYGNIIWDGTKFNITSTTPIDASISGTSSNVTGTVAIGHGGTGITAYAVGDILYCSAANTLSKLAKGTAGQFLRMGTANVPIWGDGSEVTLNGTPTTTPSFYAPTTAGTNGQILMSNGTGAPAWTDTTSITSVGTITSGTWQGGVIASAFIGAHTHNYLPLTGGDVTGLVNIKMAVNAGIHVVDTGNNNLTVGLTVGSGHQNHGVWSTGYAPTDSTFTSDGKWVIYRDSAGDARTQLRLFGAVWNDYAEYRKQAYKITPGHVVIDLDNGLVIQTEQRLMPGAQVVSDTFGFAIGENDECKTPLAVSGRVLVYPCRNRHEYHAGMAVCSAPNGTVDIMTREEIKEYPDAIVGIVSEIPQYEEWGEKPVKVDGRIWIKVK